MTISARFAVGFSCALCVASCSDDPSEGGQIGAAGSGGSAEGGTAGAAGGEAGGLAGAGGNAEDGGGTAGAGDDGAAGGAAGAGGSPAASLEITFEDLSLPATASTLQHLGMGEAPTTAVNGVFHSGFGAFEFSYDPAWSSWSGFAFSRDTDATTAGYTNQFSAIAGVGAQGTATFVVGYPPFGDGVTIPPVTVRFNEASTLAGAYFTNTTYAYLTMRDGDQFAKKFGGAAGTDPDWLRLDIVGVRADGSQTDPVAFYLADFRSDDPAQDVIVSSWQWVDLSPLGSVAGLSFYVTSTDSGTPTYFALDSLRRVL